MTSDSTPATSAADDSAGDLDDVVTNALEVLKEKFDELDGPSRAASHHPGYDDISHGVLPPPDLLDEYDAVIPDGANRLLSIIEKEQAHRHEIELGRQHLAVARQRDRTAITTRGQHYGLGIGILSLVTTIILVVLGAPAIAGIVGGSTVVGLVAAFVTGRVKEIKASKRPELPPGESGESKEVGD